MIVPGARRAVRGARATAVRAEALRMLRSNLLVAVADLDHPVVVVTSAQPGEGKTTTCAGLAASLAAAGAKVVLVDLDLRHPDLHHRLAASNEMGVVDVLAGRPLGDAMQFVELLPEERTAEPGYYFLAAGPPAANPGELIGTQGMAGLLGTVAASADIVLVDAAPVLPVADTLVLARLASGALLVVEAGRTSETDVHAARDALRRSGVRILGVALNKLDGREVRLGYGGDGGGGAVQLDGAGRVEGRWSPRWAEPAS